MPIGKACVFGSNGFVLRFRWARHGKQVMNWDVVDFLPAYSLDDDEIFLQFPLLGILFPSAVVAAVLFRLDRKRSKKDYPGNC